MWAGVVPTYRVTERWTHMIGLLVRSTLTVISIALLGATATATPLLVKVGEANDPLQQCVVSELDQYLPRLFDNPVEINGSGVPDIVVGTPDSVPDVARAVEAGKLALPAGRNSDQGYAIKKIGKTIYVTGHTWKGVLYGVYELLERYGVYFQISGERLPEKTRFSAKRLDICTSPVFRFRGLLPWHNFLCGPSGFDYEDYTALIDRATRMKLNFLQFEFQTGNAFFTETSNGKPTDPQFVGFPVDVFKTKGAVGESAFKGIDTFGPGPYVRNIGNPRAQAEACQAMMRKVIDYAHSRGIQTSITIELMYPAGGGYTFTTDKPDGVNYVDCLNPRNVELSVERYRSLVSTYPHSDYYSLWQSEGRGYMARAVANDTPSAEMRRKYAHWAHVLPFWGPDPLAGDIDYAYLFREVANSLTPEERSRLTTGGWSIEQMLPDIDSEFPKEPVFESMNAYDPSQALKYQISSFKVAESGRRTWMVDWWEYDGDMWFPQFRAGWQERMYKQCADFGVEGVLLVGWKTSGIEQNIRYLADFGWDRTLTAKTFYRNYAKRLYGPGASELASMFGSYDAIAAGTPPATPGFNAPMNLGIGIMPLLIPPMPDKPEGLKDEHWRWVVECAGNIVKQQEQLRSMDERSAAELSALVPSLDRQGQSWARLLENRFEFRAIYLKSMVRANEALVTYDRVARAKGIDAARAAAREQIGASAQLARQAIECYARDVRNRGDQGVIAHLNEQHLKVLDKLHDDLGLHR